MVDEFFIWYHVGYFAQDVEMGVLSKLADAAMKM